MKNKIIQLFLNGLVKVSSTLLFIKYLFRRGEFEYSLLMDESQNSDKQTEDKNINKTKSFISSSPFH